MPGDRRGSEAVQFPAGVVAVLGKCGFPYWGSKPTAIFLENRAVLVTTKRATYVRMGRANNRSTTSSSMALDFGDAEKVFAGPVHHIFVE